MALTSANSLRPSEKPDLLHRLQAVLAIIIVIAVQHERSLLERMVHSTLIVYNLSSDVQLKNNHIPGMNGIYAHSARNRGCSVHPEDLKNTGESATITGVSRAFAGKTGKQKDGRSLQRAGMRCA